MIQTCTDGIRTQKNANQKEGMASQRREDGRTQGINEPSKDGEQRNGNTGRKCYEPTSRGRIGVEETRTNGEKTMTEASDRNTATIHEVAEKDNKKQTKT